MTERSKIEKTNVRILNDLTGDSVLSVLSAATREGPLELGITLNVAGSIVTGTLIGEKAWFDLITNQANDAGPALGMVIGALRDGIVKSSDERHANNGEDVASVAARQAEYLHLRDAHVEVGDQLSKAAPMLWRVRITEVSAWMLGTISQS